MAQSRASTRQHAPVPVLRSGTRRPPHTVTMCEAAEPPSSRPCASWNKRPLLRIQGTLQHPALRLLWLLGPPSRRTVWHKSLLQRSR